MNLVCISCRRAHALCDCPASVRRTPLAPAARIAQPPIPPRGPIVTADVTHRSPLADLMRHHATRRIATARAAELNALHGRIH